MEKTLENLKNTITNWSSVHHRDQKFLLCCCYDAYRRDGFVIVQGDQKNLSELVFNMMVQSEKFAAAVQDAVLCKSMKERDDDDR